MSSMIQYPFYCQIVEISLQAMVLDYMSAVFRGVARSNNVGWTIRGGAWAGCPLHSRG